MKLDLLYEFQPKPGPVEGAAPVRSAPRRAADLRRGDRADPVRRHARLPHRVVRGAPLPSTGAQRARRRRPCSAGSRCRPTNIRLGFGVVLMPFGFIHPARVAEKVATVDILSHGRVEWGTGRSTPMEQIAFGVPTDDRSRVEWREAVEIVVRMWEEERFSYDSPQLLVPRAHPDAEAVPGPAPAVLARGRDRHERGQRRSQRARPARVRAAAARRGDARPSSQIYREAAAECATAADTCDERPRRRVHTRALRRRHGRSRRRTGSGTP